MAVSVVEAPACAEAPEPQRRPRRGLLVIGLLLVVSAGLITAAVTLAHAPNLSSGSFYADNPTVIEANDGYNDTKHVINGNVGGRLLTSVRNNGSVSITLLGLDNPPGLRSVLAKISFEPDPFAPNKGVGDFTPLVSHVTLKPGQEAGVVLEVRTPACLIEQKGSGVGYDSIPVKVRRLGIERSASIPLDLPLLVTYTADHPSIGNCS